MNELSPIQKKIREFEFAANEGVIPLEVWDDASALIAQAAKELGLNWGKPRAREAIRDCAVAIVDRLNTRLDFPGAAYRSCVKSGIHALYYASAN